MYIYRLEAITISILLDLVPHTVTSEVQASVLLVIIICQLLDGKIEEQYC